MAKRIKELQKRLKAEKIGCAMLFCFDRIISNPNYDYFTRFDDIGCLLIFANKPPLMLVGEMSASRAKNLGIRIKKVKGPFFEEIRKQLGAIRKVGVDGSYVTMHHNKMLRKRLPNKRIIDVSSLCEKLRMKKSDDEITILRKAFSLSDKIIDKCFANLKKFRTEKDAANFLIVEAAKYGCEMSFPPIVAAGKNSANVHHVPGNSVISRGFCMIDFGIRYKGYCTDTTRMAYVGSPSDEELETYHFMLNVQEDLVRNARRGTKCSELSKHCAKSLGSHKMIHALGHGVGLLVHERPSLSQLDNTVLETGMVVTIEPGIYLQGKYGIRIEDTLAVNPKSNEILSRTSKKLRIIK